MSKIGVIETTIIAAFCPWEKSFEPSSPTSGLTGVSPAILLSTFLSSRAKG